MNSIKVNTVPININTSSASENMPWIEKYRPQQFKDIVLEDVNKRFFKNILKQNFFPNLLLYGPPGTGKTTTIINMINQYQKKNKQTNKGLKIHLNASDDRGIDIIRNQINSFVNTKSLFGGGLKFVILDEVDYMTKNAQKALRYLIQQHSNNIRFCLICNYISKIDMSLQNEFVRIRFCQLPYKNIYEFLKKITIKENIKIKRQNINSIINIFYPDIRSMINYIQSNHFIFTNEILSKNNTNAISIKDWEKLINQIKTKKNIDTIKNNIIELCYNHNIKIKNFIEFFVEYMFKTHTFIYNTEWLNIIEFTFHNLNTNSNILLNYFIDSIYCLDYD